MCQGDCDQDSDCASGLRCFFRTFGHTRSSRLSWIWSIWLKMITAWTKSFYPRRSKNGKGTGGLGLCEGDCDNDSDCGSGLTCYKRDGAPIPGCWGSGKKDWDYCVAIANPPPPPSPRVHRHHRHHRARRHRARRDHRHRAHRAHRLQAHCHREVLGRLKS